MSESGREGFRGEDVCAATSAHNEQQPDGFAGQKVMKRVIDSGDSVVRLKAQTPSGERS